MTIIGKKMNDMAIVVKSTENPMKYSIDSQNLEVDIGLTKSSVNVEFVESDSVELDFLGLRKKTVEEVFSVSYRKNRLFIKEKSRGHSPFFDSILNTGAPSDLTLKVPVDTSISGKISTLRGDIKAAKIEFRGELKTITGNIAVDRISSDGLNLSNISGETQLGEFEGYLKGNIVTGRLQVETGLYKEISIRGMSGNISLAGKFDLESDASIQTLSGNINLNIEDYQGDNLIELSTLGGNTVVAGNYPKECIHIRKRMPFIKENPFKSFFSPMKDMFSSVFHSSNDDEVEIHAEATSEDNEHVKTILQMVSDGKINAEEAEKLIRALGKK